MMLLGLQSRQYKNYECVEPSFILRSFPFLFLSLRVDLRLFGLITPWFQRRSSENIQIFRSHHFKHPARYTIIQQLNFIYQISLCSQELKIGLYMICEP